MGELERIEVAKAKWEAKQNMRSYSHRQRQKYEKQSKELLEVIKCSCGNEIRMFNQKTEVKCFKCNHFWLKNSVGKWEKEEMKAPRNALTIEDVLKQKGIVVRHKS